MVVVKVERMDRVLTYFEKETRGFLNRVVAGNERETSRVFLV